MQEKTKGIILYQTKIADNKILVKIYTKDFGLLTFLCVPSRTKHSKLKPALLQNLSQLDINFIKKNTGTIHHLKELNFLYSYKTFGSDILKSSIAGFLNEVIYKSVKEEDEVNEVLFDFIITSFQWLDQTEEYVSNFHLYFLSEFSKHIGFYPQNNFQKESPYFDLLEGVFKPQAPMHSHYIGKEDAVLFSELFMLDLKNIRYYQITHQQRISLLHHLMHYFSLHVPGFKEIRSLKVLQETFA